MTTDDEWMGVDAALARFGLPARPADRPTIIAALAEQTDLIKADAGDPHLLRLLCAQVFSLGVVEDSLWVWRAKECNFDTHCGVDVQLLCGGGWEPTMKFLQDHGSDLAKDAMQYLRACESDFAEFRVEHVLQQEREFYGVV